MRLSCPLECQCLEGLERWELGEEIQFSQNTEGQGARPSNISVHRTVWGTQ